MKLEGRVAFVTGAASGIGQATALLLREEGMLVAAADLDKSRLKEALGGVEGVTVFPLDVSDSAAVNEAFAQVDRFHGRLDALVNAAGINAPTPEANQALVDANVRGLEAMKRGETPRFDFLEDTSDEDFRRTLEVNLFSQFYTLRAAAPIMKRTGGGSVVNVSSVAALIGAAMPLYYPASKAGVLGLTRAAAVELAPYGIRVNAIAPGAVDTPLMHQQPDEVVQFLLGLQKIPRLAAPEEIARTIVFLCADDTGGYYTGQTISPSGGTYM
ncbi:SDR family NAD(P)-dependent oxidoreductase [Actinomadura sp. SCN-SB]|uniref:SDR family NAD(P)-dependent oxidoreductase n=1 Tax=Actinomadura sp. SCN-SB TaxID=3373092 RepID=UPI003753DD3A